MIRKALKDIYKRLYEFYGPQGWWPGDTRLEMIVGAVLTQNTAWTNVEKAIENLKRSGALSHPSRILKMTGSRLGFLIKPSGYYNIKSARLKNLMSFLSDRYGADLDKVSRQKTSVLRRELLDVNGVGPETCDSILLYAFRKPVFVVDAYTKRIFSRHGLLAEDAEYGEVQALFMASLPEDHKLYNEYHALIVRLGKEKCRKAPDCANCPLSRNFFGFTS